MKKRARLLAGDLPRFPSLLITADGTAAQGAFAEAQVGLRGWGCAAGVGAEAVRRHRGASCGRACSQERSRPVSDGQTLFRARL